MLKSAISEGVVPADLKCLPLSSCASAPQIKETALYIRTDTVATEYIVEDPIQPFSAPIIFGQRRDARSTPDLPGSFPTIIGMKPEKLARTAVKTVIVYPAGYEYIGKLIVYYLHQYTNRWHYAIYHTSDWKLAVKIHINKPYLSGLVPPSTEPSARPLHGRDIPSEIGPHFPPSPSSSDGTHDSSVNYDDAMTISDEPVLSQVDTQMQPSIEEDLRKRISALTQQLAEQAEKLRKLENVSQRDTKSDMFEQVDECHMHCSPMLQSINSTATSSMCSSANSSTCVSGYVSCCSEYASPDTSPDRPKHPQSMVQSESIFQKSNKIKRNLFSEFSKSACVSASSSPPRPILPFQSADYDNSNYNLSEIPDNHDEMSVLNTFPISPVAWSVDV